MLFLVELDHVTPTTAVTADSASAFIEQIIFPTITRAEQLVAEKKVLSGGPVAGRIALRLMVEAESANDLDEMISSLPLWRNAETRVTPLITFAERRQHLRQLMKHLASVDSARRDPNEGK